MQLLKGGSSKWIHETFPSLANFAWQDGYAAFSVCESIKDAVINYIFNQRMHHTKRTFQQEFVEMLNKNEIEYDEAYLWD